MAKKKIKKFINILWWSLAIHLILLAIILFLAFKDSSIFVPLKKKSLSKKDQSNIPAALKPRKSAFGSTVFFDDRATFKPSEAPLMGPQKMLEQQEKLSIPKEEIIEQQPKPEIQVKEENKKKIDEKIETIKKPEIKKIAKVIPELEKKQIEIQKSKPEKDEIEKKIKEIQKTKTKVAQAKTKLAKQISIPKMQTYRTIGVSQKDQSPIKRKRSIIAMTKGFIENLEHKGNDWLERDGDENKRPSSEELEHNIYRSKIQWALQNCWKLNFEPNPTQYAPSCYVTVSFQINANGTVQDITLRKSSGYPHVDNNVLKNIELASPLPPIPKHFGLNTWIEAHRIHVINRR